MIGQKNLQSRISQLIENRTFPRFSIFVGPRGSGKKTFAKELKRLFDDWRVSSDTVNVYMLPDVKIDTIREIITQAYKQTTTMLYIIPDADNMSNAAKNALLKVTEEPPNNAYFIMTLEDENNTLETIRSRGTVFHMDRYTPDEIEEYYRKRFCLAETTIELERKEISIVRDLCETPGDVEIIMKHNATHFYDYVQLVVDNIAEVSTANAFKIPSKVALKDDAEGYDLRLFWKAFIKICMERSFDDIEDKFEEARHAKMMICAAQRTSAYLKSLRVRGINKQMLIDNWLLEVRELWS